MRPDRERNNSRGISVAEVPPHDLAYVRTEGVEQRFPPRGSLAYREPVQRTLIVSRCRGATACQPRSWYARRVCFTRHTGPSTACAGRMRQPHEGHSLIVDHSFRRPATSPVATTTAVRGPDCSTRRASSAGEPSGGATSRRGFGAGGAFGRRPRARSSSSITEVMLPPDTATASSRASAASAEIQMNTGRRPSSRRRL